MVTENNFYFFIFGIFAFLYFAAWIIDKSWWWYVDKSLEGHETKEIISKEYFAEKYGIELSDTETASSGFIFETLCKAIFWLSRVLLIGGLGGILGIILAANFGHEEIFVWPGICLGAVIGAVSGLFFLFKIQADHSKNTDTFVKKPHIKVNLPEVIT
jgi:hypothetical protein